MGRHANHLAVAVVIMAMIVAANIIFGGRLSHWAADLAGPGLASLAGRVSGSHAFLDTMFRRDLVAENIRLTEEVRRLQVQAAVTDEFRREAEFARAVAGLRGLAGSQPLAAAIFSYPRAGGIREAVIDKGVHDRITVGDIVITASGALIGVVRETYDRHATVLTLGDPLLEVTGRVLGTEISGLVRADGADGLVLDLVSRDETVSEGQVVVTSGNDRFPPALLVGTVRSVDAARTTLFTVVRLSPAVAQPVDGRVLVVRP